VFAGWLSSEFEALYRYRLLLQVQALSSRAQVELLSERVATPVRLTCLLMALGVLLPTSPELARLEATSFLALL